MLSVRKDVNNVQWYLFTNLNQEDATNLRATFRVSNEAIGMSQDMSLLALQVNIVLSKNDLKEKEYNS